jgi:hypothetical protein
MLPDQRESSHLTRREDAKLIRRAVSLWNQRPTVNDMASALIHDPGYRELGAVFNAIIQVAPE